MALGKQFFSKGAQDPGSPMKSKEKNQEQVPAHQHHVITAHIPVYTYRNRARPRSERKRRKLKGGYPRKTTATINNIEERGISDNLYVGVYYIFSFFRAQARELAEKEEGITELNREFRDLEEEVTRPSSGQGRPLFTSVYTKQLENMFFVTLVVKLVLRRSFPFESLWTS